jgi:sugar lactone lactonase YvrE
MMNQPMLAQDETVGTIELVATFDGPMPTGVSVSHTGRIFVNFPNWEDPLPFTVAELQDGHLVAYPNAEMNHFEGSSLSTVLVSVQSIVVDPKDRLWILDTGAPQHKITAYGGPKLVGVDLKQNRVIKTILFPADVAVSTTYLNDIRFDLRRGSEGMAFITDSSPLSSALIIVDLASGQSWRRLHNHITTRPEEGFMPMAEGQPLMLRPADGPPTPYHSGVDGIAIGADGSRLFYSALMSRKLYSVSVDALVERAKSEEDVIATIVNEGDKGGAGDGMETDAANRLYMSNYEQNAIVRRRTDGLYETLVHDARLLWPDTLSLAYDGYLYFTVNQLHRSPRFHEGKDLRQKPYCLFRCRVDAQPVLLGGHK